MYGNDDLVHEVFLAAATGLARFRRDQSGDTFRGWLYGITRNTLLCTSAGGPASRWGRGTEPQRQLQRLADPDVHLPDDPPEQSRAVSHRALEMMPSPTAPWR